MKGDEDAAFRAVIVTTYTDGQTSTSYAGPYATKGAARAAITREQSRATRWYWRDDPRPRPVVTGHVERASAWAKVEDEQPGRPMTGEEILRLPMGANDANAETIRGYLVALARGVWYEGEGFSGKRPFGDSGWHHDVLAALIRGGAISGEVDEDEFASAFEWRDAWEAIGLACDALRSA